MNTPITVKHKGNTGLDVIPGPKGLFFLLLSYPGLPDPLPLI